MENDYIYVGYISGDYAHACWVSKDQAKIQKEISKYKARGGRSNTYIERYVLKPDNLIRLDND